jgi:hypothetical protein
MSIMRSSTIFVNSATFSVFIKVKDVPQSRFAVDVIPCFLFYYYFIF